VNIPHDSNWTFSLCGEATWDTYLYLGYDRCTYFIANDDYCGVQSQITTFLTAGQYYLTVEAYSASVCGDYVLEIWEEILCDPTCPPNGMPEGEPNCGTDYVDSYNGGCNSTPWVFQDITNCVICGKSGVYSYQGLTYRDTDWFQVVLDEPTDLTWSGCANFPLLMFIIQGAGPNDCSSYAILASGTGNAYQPVTLNAFAVPAGTYWFWAGPSVWDYSIDCETAIYLGELTTNPNICICGDFNEDGHVNELDYYAFLDAFGACDPDPRYFAAADFNNSGCIDLEDYQAWIVCWRDAGSEWTGLSSAPRPVHNAVPTDPVPGTITPGIR